jgi:hypothetical protein
MKGFFESVRTELEHKGSNVHVTMVQLPAVNTPQFDRCRSKMPKKPMPVPPIYQPEVAADAVHWAAHARRRQVYVGAPTVYTIIGNKLVPALGDVYLAKTGVDAQQTDEPVDAPREGNLFAPPGGDPGSHGDFDRQAHPRSVQLWLVKHRGAAAVAALAAGGALAATLRR